MAIQVESVNIHRNSLIPSYFQNICIIKLISFALSQFSKWLRGTSIYWMRLKCWSIVANHFVKLQLQCVYIAASVWSSFLCMLTNLSRPIRTAVVLTLVNCIALDLVFLACVLSSHIGCNPYQIEWFWSFYISIVEINRHLHHPSQNTKNAFHFIEIVVVIYI